MNSPTAFVVGELKSKDAASQKFRIGKYDEVAASCREWKVALLGENPPHPAALTLMAAASMIDDLAATVARQEQELQAWAAFAEQSSKRAIALRDCTNLAANLLDAVKAAGLPVDRATEIRIENARNASA